ncbi:P9 membrane protein [Pseudomonas phage phi13]|uniref:p9 n=1 Tax=Pseudomonas phage phi13 TaxID=134554 RepID=Q9FZU0_9VIRU|nr:P9 membrane protein [Pseudomonas phage phi13]AAG00436.1 P9 [Pseudomonas phage phi13]
MGLYTTYKKSAEQTVDKENDSIGKKVVGFLTAPVSFKDDVLSLRNPSHQRSRLGRSDLPGRRVAGSPPCG